MDEGCGRGPQGDAIRIYNYVRCVCDADFGPTPTPTPWAFPRRVSFQTASSDIPDGYAADNGSVFTQHGEYEYGWQ